MQLADCDEWGSSMDIINFGASLAIVREHGSLFAFLMIAVPAFSFLSMKSWLATRATARVQRRTRWVVQCESDSEKTPGFADLQSRSVAFAHRSHNEICRVAALKSAATKRIA
jgi:hypothetical protein